MKHHISLKAPNRKINICNISKCSPELKVVIVQIVCVVEIQSESAWTLTNITSGNTCHAEFHASEASGSEEDDFHIFLCISLVQTQDTLGRIYFGPWGHYLNKLA